MIHKTPKWAIALSVPPPVPVRDASCVSHVHRISVHKQVDAADLSKKDGMCIRTAMFSTLSQVRLYTESWSLLRKRIGSKTKLIYSTQQEYEFNQRDMQSLPGTEDKDYVGEQGSLGREIVVQGVVSCMARKIRLEETPPLTMALRTSRDGLQRLLHPGLP